MGTPAGYMDLLPCMFYWELYWEKKKNPFRDLSRCFILDTESDLFLTFFIQIKTTGVQYFVYKYVQLVSCKKWAPVSGPSFLEVRVLLEHHSLEDHSGITIKVHDLQVIWSKVSFKIMWER